MTDGNKGNLRDYKTRLSAIAENLDDPDIELGVIEAAALRGCQVQDVHRDLKRRFPVQWHKAQHPKKERLSRSLGSITPRNVRWLWPYKFPLGKLSLLAGDPATGKSTITLDIIARVTRGKAWPHSTDAPKPMNVLLLTVEDDEEDTIVPRLMAAGADMDRVYLMPSIVATSEGILRGLTIAQDIGKLRSEVKAIGNVGLIVVDPLSAYIGARNAHADADIRGVMTPFCDFARESGIAIIGISHLNKNTTGQSALQRISGAGAMGAVARAVYMTLRQDDQCYMVNAKPSLSARRLAHGFTYTIESATIAGNGEKIETSRVKWGDPCEMSADELMASMSTAHKQPKRDEAKDWLLHNLKSGPKHATEIIEAAEQAGHSQRTLKRLREENVYTISKSGFQGQYIWYTPEQFARLQAQKKAYLERKDGIH